MFKDAATTYPIANPAIRHKLSQLREKSTQPKQFRELVHELSNIMVYEASKLLTAEEYDIVTPLGEAKGYRIKEKIAVAPILRSGVGMVSGAIDLFPNAAVYHIGMYRDKRSLQPIEYYSKLPNTVDVDVVYVLDPMIATGGTAIATISLLKEWGAPRVEVVAIIASKFAMDKLRESHPDVVVHVCGIDNEINEDGYIVPGLGDAGDRQFSTPH
eukprot:TRINITY_DN12956_c0_g1_i1.p1 TRINITY_DN12956_c0_g1~~TRINITY_DN12956_c0_g1_i1.p1  ORF type:complete len:214 (-),score=99.15 TRINITY_DN12956_c0_g1_i1:121-762(-)